MVLERVLRHVRFERDPRALEKDHAVWAVVQRRVPVIRVVEAGEVFGDTHGVDAGGDVFENSGVPDSLLAFAVRSVVIEVCKLADERAFTNARSADNGHAHGPDLTAAESAGSVLYRRVTCADTASHLPFRRAQTSV